MELKGRTWLLLPLSLCLLTFLAVFSHFRQTAVLESAIMPPISFRKWFVGESKKIFKHEGRSSVPMDRFAGHASWTKPTVVPGYYEKGNAELRAQYEPEVKEIKKDIEKTREELKAEIHSKEWRELKKHESADYQKLKNVYNRWYSSPAQKKVQSLNKDLVIGRARSWNKDQYLGGSDHFVSVKEATKQLEGGGYGHRYSITDWLSGN